MTRKRKLPPVEAPPPKTVDASIEKRGSGDGRPKFPTELIRYLEHISRLPPDPDVDLTQKCLEEVEGEEETLLRFSEGCLLVEKIFGAQKSAAFEFLQKLERKKKSQRSSLIFNSTSGRTLEKLFVALIPIEAKHSELLNSWLELIVDEWTDVIFDRAAAFFVRALSRALCGLTEKEIRNADLRINSVTRPMIQKLIIRAFDFQSMKTHLDLPSCSLILQDLAAIEKTAKTGAVREFVVRFLAEEDVEKSWSSAESSRFWEAVLGVVDDELRETIFNSLEDRLLESLILDQLFQFADPDHLLDFDVEMQTQMSEQKIASHVFDSLIPRLCSNQYGTRVFEAFWFEVPIQHERYVRLLLPMLKQTSDYESVNGKKSLDMESNVSSEKKKLSPLIATCICVLIVIALCALPIVLSILFPKPLEKVNCVNDASLKRMEQQMELLIKQNTLLVNEVALLKQSAARSEQKIEEMKQSNSQQFKVIQTMMRTEMTNALQSNRTTEEMLTTQKEEKIVAKVDARNTTEECTLFCRGLKSTGNGIKIAVHYFGYPYRFVFGKTTSTAFSLCTWLLIIGLLILKFKHFKSEKDRDETKSTPLPRQLKQLLPL
ncbi:hypothetical protein M3Y94_00678200 [Aphelenchoides besseyi]|nr:hypothetical protein M3Y94_00678200 [Aphelenchoides besseyi]